MKREVVGRRRKERGMRMSRNFMLGEIFRVLLGGQVILRRLLRSLRGIGHG